MKKRSILVSGITLIAVALCVVACRKDRATYGEASGDNTATSLSVKDARKYFYNVLRKSQSTSVLSVASSPDGKNRKVYPYWSHAYASRTKKFDFVELPVASVHQQRNLRTTGSTMTDAESKSVLAASFTRLVLYKNRKGVMNQRLITFIPDYAYLKKHNNDVSYNHIDKLDNDFSGYLEYRDWDNTLLFSLKLANGVVVGRFKPGQRANKQQVQSINTADFKNKTNTDGCITYQVTVWEQDCIDFSDPDNPGAGVVTVCSAWYIAEQYYETECPDIDCSDPANFDDAECGGGGGDDNGCEVYSYVKNGVRVFDTNCNEPPPDDPCGTDKSSAKNTANNRIGGNSSVASAMTSSISYGNNNQESAFLINSSSSATISATTPIPSAAGETSSAVTPTANTIGIGHDHPAGGFPQPSPWDFYKAAELNGSSNGNIDMSLVTSPTDNYIIMVSDPTAAAAFLAKYPKTDNMEKDANGNYTSADFNPNSALGTDVNNVGVDAAGNYLATHAVNPAAPTQAESVAADLAANEASLVFFVANYSTGMTLLKKNPTTGDFEALHFTATIVGNKTIYTVSPCN